MDQELPLTGLFTPYNHYFLTIIAILEHGIRRYLALNPRSVLRPTLRHTLLLLHATKSALSASTTFQQNQELRRQFPNHPHVSASQSAPPLSSHYYYRPAPPSAGPPHPPPHNPVGASASYHADQVRYHPYQPASPPEPPPTGPRPSNSLSHSTGPARTPPYRWVGYIMPYIQ